MAYSLGNLNGLSVAEFLQRYDITKDIWYYPDPTLVWAVINGQTTVVVDRAYLIKTLSDGKWWYIVEPEALYGLSGVPAIEEITDPAFIAQQEQGWAGQEQWMAQTGATYEQMSNPNFATPFPKHIPGLPAWVPVVPTSNGDTDTDTNEGGCDCDCEEVVTTEKWVLTPYCTGSNCYPVKVKVRKTICEGGYNGSADFDCNDIEQIRQQMNQGV